MCGIVGFAAVKGAEPPVRARLDDAVASLSHRGPDGHGTFRSDRVLLGSTRLSIIDLPGGAQPIANEDGTIVVVYNGEIWNHHQLRDQLTRLGHRFCSRSDTEVLVHGYEEWGEDLPVHLDGMFAFAVWDSTRQRLFAARDRLGKKPLYLARTGAGLAFGSDARALFLVADKQPELDHGRVAEYLFHRYVTSPGTMFAGVERLPPAHRASYDGVNLEISCYWQLDVPQTPEPLDPRELRQLLSSAVERRLMSDVPVGVLLSAGVDSTSILALAREHMGSAPATFTIGFDDDVFDERPVARSSAAHFGSDHYELVVDGRDFLKALPRLAWFRDEPIAEASEIPLLLLAEFAGRHVKVALSGDGGDEVFGGYPKYRADAVLRMGGRPVALFASAMLRAMSRRRGHRQLGRAAASVLIRDPLLRWASWFRSIDVDQIEAVLAPALADNVSASNLTAPLERVLRPYSELDAGRRMLLGDLFTYLPDNMLLRSDKVLMAASLEGRMPLLDIDVITRSSGSSAGDRASLRGSKRTIRQAVGELLPPEVLRQPKRGFPVPIERFLADGAARSHLEGLILSERALSRDIFRPDYLRAIVRGDESRIGARELFVLASLEMWMRANVDALSIHPPSVEESPSESSSTKRPLSREDETEHLGRTRRPHHPADEHQSPPHPPSADASRRGPTLGSAPSV